MKQIKAGEYLKTRCSFCPLKATWRSSKASMYSCDGHRAKLKEEEHKRNDDGYMTEADYQTWARL